MVAVAGPRAALHNVQRRLVRSVITERSPAADAIFDIAGEGRHDWTATEWAKMLQQLDQCEMTVADWLLTV